MKAGTLTFFCGKMGAGKSTRSRTLATEQNAVLISEDEWLASLYPDAITSLADYVKYSSLLKPQIEKLVRSMLSVGTDVVMDFPANTTAQRDWFRQIFTAAGAEHRLIYIDVTDELCLERIEKRRLEQPGRAATDTPEMFRQITQLFAAPSSDEGFNVVRYPRNGH